MAQEGVVAVPWAFQAGAGPDAGPGSDHVGLQMLHAFLEDLFSSRESSLSHYVGVPGRHDSAECHFVMRLVVLAFSRFQHEWSSSYPLQQLFLSLCPCFLSYTPYVCLPGAAFFQPSEPHGA